MADTDKQDRPAYFVLGSDGTLWTAEEWHKGDESSEK